jgi:hypothetical protein
MVIMAGSFAILIIAFLLANGATKIIIGISILAFAIACFAIPGFLFSVWAMIIADIVFFGGLLYVILRALLGKSR